ncbi:MAG: YdcH family protein [Alphaproteobacteria bacterium]
MSEPSSLASLRDQHASLHLMIEEEQRRRMPDALKLKELKRQKLKIKDEIAEATSH